MPVNYRDPTHITEENWVDMNKVDEVHRLLAKWLREKMYGRDVREALARLAEQVSSDIYDDRQVALALEKLAKELQAKWDRDTQKIIDEWKNTIGGVTVDSEVINSRIDIQGIVYKTLKERLDDMQSKIENLDATESVFKLTHNQNCYPTLRVFYSTYGAAVVPSEEEPTGAGGSEVKYVHAEPLYHDLDSMTVKVPFKYKMVNPTIERISENQYLLVEDIRTLLVEIGSKGEANVETTMEYTSTLDYKNKVANSIVDNPNIFYYGAGGWTELKKPGDPSWGEYIQRHVVDVSHLDNRSFETLRYNQSVIAQSWLRFNVVEDFKRKYPSLFNGLTPNQEVALVKGNVVKLSLNVNTKGSNSAGDKATVKIFQDDSKWAGGWTNTTDKFSMIRTTFTYSGNITNKGTVDAIVYAEPSDGKTASSLYIDYA
ncbi:hypothetical protein, partial [Carnobacterium divergens]|uniref:hypothetical protein n=1 Tax=Carnobacterium divergens TaxID=2748 RepID=UPI0014308498